MNKYAAPTELTNILLKCSIDIMPQWGFGKKINSLDPAL